MDQVGTWRLRFTASQCSVSSILLWYLELSSVCLERTAILPRAYSSTMYDLYLLVTVYHFIASYCAWFNLLACFHLSLPYALPLACCIPRVFAAAAASSNTDWTLPAANFIVNLLSRVRSLGLHGALILMLAALERGHEGTEKKFGGWQWVVPAGTHIVFGLVIFIISLLYPCSVYAASCTVH